jgi:uncharacterized protein YgiM (DUF1202 family)
MRIPSAHRCLARSLNLIVVAAIIAITATGRLARGDEFSPYRARVVSASAPVRSGPGESFYPTDTLAEGDTVEVYRQDSNGWCAIRPPDGSFSWVFARHVKLRGEITPDAGDALAEIDKPDVASRIGSRLSASRNAVQVRLKKGEVVRIVGQESAGTETWYKIAPPAGEFRWIHSSSIQRGDSVTGGNERRESEEAPPLPTVTAAATRASSKDEAGVTAAAATAPESAKPAPAVAVNAVAQSPVATPAAGNEWRATPDKPEGTAAAPGAISQLIAPPLRSDPPAPTTNATAAAPPQPTATSADRPARSIADLELRLSRMVAEPPSAWNTAPLQAEAESLLVQAPTLADRQVIQATLAKIERFAAIERRSRGSAGVSPAGGSQFDAVGVLRPVTSRRPGAPPFALVDERGQVLSFVTPTPGVNLQPFLGQRIGVNGNRGYIPEFQRTHVMAGRVAPVTDRTLR